LKTARILFSLLVVLTFYIPSIEGYAQEASCAQWLDHEVNQLHSTNVIDLCGESAGKPLLLVNTASYCGFTYQFTGLEKLYQRFKDQGLVIMGFPSDDFNQEDNDAAKTAEVCYINHGVTFLMTEVIKVKGRGAHPVFAHLSSETREPQWNFNKYLVSADGKVLKHFNQTVEPDAAEMINAIESLLQ